MEAALPVAGQDDRVFAHIGVEEIVGRGHQALMPDHQPGAPEDLLHLGVVDRPLAEDAAIEFAGGRVDGDVLPSGTHSRILPPAVMIAGAAHGEPAFDPVESEARTRNSAERGPSKVRRPEAGTGPANKVMPSFPEPIDFARRAVTLAPSLSPEEVRCPNPNASRCHAVQTLMLQVS